MSRQTVSTLLFTYLLCLLVPVVFKLDYFPLTWAPMYSAIKSSDTYKITMLDRSRVKNEGFSVKHRDGTLGHVTHHDLNIPFRNFYPLYSQRIYSIGPPKHRRAIDDCGKYNTVQVDWEARLFNSINSTLGHQENDPEFITEISASKTILYYVNTKTHLELARSLPDTITIKWENPGSEPGQKPHLACLDE